MGKSRAELADQLSETLIFEAFVSVAVGYTNDELISLGDLLSAQDSLDDDDVRELLVEGYRNPEGVREKSMRDFASTRAIRQSERVARAKQVEGAAVREAEGKLGVAHARIRSLEETVQAGGTSSQKSRRTIEALVFMAVACIVFAVAVAGGHLALKWVLLAGCALAFSAFEAIHYVANFDRSRWIPIAGTLSIVVAGVALWVLDEYWDLPR